MSAPLARPTWTIARLDSPLSNPGGDWQGQVWGAVPALAIDRFHSRSTNHRPQVRAKLAHDGSTLAVIWRVEDYFVRSVTTGCNGPVCTDSCVEFFFRPTAGPGYFNLEINAGGHPHCSWIEDCTFAPGGFAKFRFLSEDDLGQIRIHHSLPSVIEPELVGPRTWTIEAHVPLSLLQRYAGADCQLSGTWQGNLYKCADQTSHPHWAAWADVGEQLSFHKPSHFAPLILGT
jgi:hypothetical protein